MHLNGYDYSELVRIIDLFLDRQYGEEWHRFCENYMTQRDTSENLEEFPNVENQDTNEDLEEN